MTRDFIPVIGGVVVVVLVFVGYVVVEAIDRFTESPVMRHRVNEGSDKFLAGRGSLGKAASRGAMAFLARFARRDFLDP